MIIGTLPVVIALVSNRRDAKRDGQMPWSQLLPSLLLIGMGIMLVNAAEFEHLQAAGQVDLTTYVLGALLAVGALVCWTWYPLRNADWLRQHGERSAATWATAQGVATLPLALLGYAAFWLWSAGFGQGDSSFVMPLGPTPGRYVALMLALGLFASWLGTLCWNAASQRLPTTLVAQLIVFETLAALAYVFLLRGQVPAAVTLVGIGLLVLGVAVALRRRPAAETASSAL